MAARNPDTEKSIGLRCHCGRQIVDGYEWYIHELGLDENRQMKSYVTTVRTCGNNCTVEQRLVEEGTALARMPISIEWLVEDLPGEATPGAQQRTALDAAPPGPGD
jgi:hypothetical protein